MRSARSRTVPAIGLAALAGFLPVALVGCAFHLPPKPEIYKAHTKELKLLDHGVHFHCVRPVKPRTPLTLILFATGDTVWLGTSHEVFEHMADRGYYITACNTREVLRHARESGRLLEMKNAAAAVDSIIVQSRRILGLPETTPVIVTGFSRGANLVVVTAGVKSLQHQLGGAIAMALTRETDYFRPPDPALRPPQVQVDEKGHIQTYPLIELAGPIPFAVIQSQKARYVPAEAARRLFGPASATRRLYQVDARNHGFGGGREGLMSDLDDALDWIEGKAKGG